jgi:hypothetical protein
MHWCKSRSSAGRASMITWLLSVRSMNWTSLGRQLAEQASTIPRTLPADLAPSDASPSQRSFVKRLCLGRQLAEQARSPSRNHSTPFSSTQSRSSAGRASTITRHAPQVRGASAAARSSAGRASTITPSAWEVQAATTRPPVRVPTNMNTRLGRQLAEQARSHLVDRDDVPARRVSVVSWASAGVVIIQGSGLGRQLAEQARSLGSFAYGNVDCGVSVVSWPSKHDHGRILFNCHFAAIHEPLQAPYPMPTDYPSVVSDDRDLLPDYDDMGDAGITCRHDKIVELAQGSR